MADTRAPELAAQSTSSLVRSPAKAPTSTTERAPTASRQGSISSAWLRMDVAQRVGSFR